MTIEGVSYVACGLLEFLLCTVLPPKGTLAANCDPAQQQLGTKVGVLLNIAKFSFPVLANKFKISAGA